VGFEPTVPVTRDNGFQDRRIQPLCHLSIRSTRVIEMAIISTSSGAPERSRTSNLQIRSLTLYPIELQALSFIGFAIRSLPSPKDQDKHSMVERVGFEPTRPVTQTLA
jgi:hypothetical protein